MKKHSGKYLLAMVSLGVLLGTSEVSAYVIYSNWPGGWNQTNYYPVRGGRVYYYGPSYYNRSYPYYYRNPYTYRNPYSYGYRYPYNYNYYYNYPRATTTQCPLVTGYFDTAGIWHPPYRACINY
jgi:hypothetical protein